MICIPIKLALFGIKNVFINGGMEQEKITCRLCVNNKFLVWEKHPSPFTFTTEDVIPNPVTIDYISY